VIEGCSPDLYTEEWREMLHTEPSFAIYNPDEGLPWKIKNGDSVVEAMGKFSFGKGMGLIDEKDGEG